jgi:hypothetical protein
MRKISDSEFSKRMIELHPNIVVLDHYTNIRTKINCRCEICTTEWQPTPKRLFNGQGCPICCYTKKRQTTEQFRKMLFEVSPHIEHLEDYPKNNMIKTRVKCHLCEFEWLSRPAHLLSGNGCPNCSKTGYKSGKPGMLYLIQFPEFIKYGITNNPKRRFNSHKKQGMIKVIETYEFNDGEIPIKLENLIKTTLGGKYVSKKMINDGWTETLSNESLAKVQLLIKNFTSLL